MQRGRLGQCTSSVTLYEQYDLHEGKCGDGEVRKVPGIVGNGQLQFRYAVLTGGPCVDVDSLESRIIYIM